MTSLLIIDSNPVYAAPATLGFAEALKKVDFSLALTPTPNETSEADHLGGAHGACVGILERCPRL